MQLLAPEVAEPKPGSRARRQSRRARWRGDEEKGRPCDVVDRSRGRRVTSQDGNLHGRPGAREQVWPCDVLALRRRARRPGAREQVRPCDEEQGKAAARRREQQGRASSR